MAKLKDLHISVKNEYGDSMSIETPVSVTKDGLFVTTLPQAEVLKLDQYNVQLMSNRLGNPGYFTSKTLEGLEKDIRDIMKEALSRELIENTEVIRYEVYTDGCCFVDKDNNIHPNGGCVKDGEWPKFDNPYGATCGHTPTLCLYARVYEKKTWRYASGKTFSEYHFPSVSYDDKTNLGWLKGQVNIKQKNNFSESYLQEIPATEENAKVFVTILKSIYKASLSLNAIKHPDTLLKFIENGRTIQLSDADEQ